RSMLLVLVIGTVGYGFLSNPGGPNTNKGHNEGDVIYNGNRWVATLNGEDFYFINSPESIENISVDISFSLINYQGISLYLVSDSTAVNSEIATTFGRFASRIQEACYGPCDKDLPEKNCTENLIIWQDSPENRVYQKENCIFIEGDMRAVDAFLYRILEMV
ncbi:MAG: hypothetical protein KKD94_05290, partial [Nanoarchaeota archaeon]|nr:hypothetical protein [Nanoarchaeota archaeon]